MNHTVMYIGGFELPDKNAAAHRVVQNAKAFRKLGKQVVLIGIGHGAVDQDDLYRTKFVTYGFECYMLPYPDRLHQWKEYLTGINRYLEVFKHYQDIAAVVLYDFPSIALRKMLGYCSSKGIRCYADITEWYSAKGRGPLYCILKGCDTFYRMRILHKRLDGLIVISWYLRKYYKNMGTVACIPPLVDIQEQKWINMYQKSEHRLMLVYAGEPGRKDRIDILIDALVNVKRAYQLDVVGITLEQYLKRMPRHEKYLKKNKNILFHGRIPHLDALEFVKKANYSCFFREVNRVSMAGFPTKFVEAISCGTPVLTNQTSDLAAYCSEGKNGYVLEKFDRDEIACQIERIPFVMDTQADLFDYRKYVKRMKRFCE